MLAYRGAMELKQHASRFLDWKALIMAQETGLKKGMDLTSPTDPRITQRRLRASHSINGLSDYSLDGSVRSEWIVAICWFREKIERQC